MTTPGPPGLPGPWPDVLAAYADGELDPDARAAVERWLAAHPGAVDDLRVQRELSPENRRLWRQAEPPLPSEDTWAAVREAVADAAMPQPATPAAPREAARADRPGSWRRTGVWFGGGVAAALLIAVALRMAGGFRPPPPRPVPLENAPRTDFAGTVHPDDPLAGIPILPVAGAGEVEIHRVVGEGGWLVVGEHPLPGPLVLAGEDEVEVDWADEHPAWPDGAPRITRDPGDAPMIYAASPR